MLVGGLMGDDIQGLLDDIQEANEYKPEIQDEDDIMVQLYT